MTQRAVYVFRDKKRLCKLHIIIYEKYLRLVFEACVSVYLIIESDITRTHIKSYN